MFINELRMFEILLVKRGVKLKLDLLLKIIGMQEAYSFIPELPDEDKEQLKKNHDMALSIAKEKLEHMFEKHKAKKEKEQQNEVQKE